MTNKQKVIKKFIELSRLRPVEDLSSHITLYDSKGTILGRLYLDDRAIITYAVLGRYAKECYISYSTPSMDHKYHSHSEVKIPKHLLDTIDANIERERAK